MLRGKKIKKENIRVDVVERYSGKLKLMSENDIRRLFIKLLILKALKEQFTTQTVKGINVSNVFVNLQPGRENTMKNVIEGRIRVIMSDGAKKEDKMEFSDE